MTIEAPHKAVMRRCLPLTDDFRARLTPPRCAAPAAQLLWARRQQGPLDESGGKGGVMPARVARVVKTPNITRVLADRMTRIAA